MIGEFVPLPVEVVEVEVTGAGEGREPMPAGVQGRDSGRAGRRIEFALGSVAPPALVVESVTAEEVAAAGTGEALGRTLAVRASVPQARGGTRVLRGSFGYRVPLVVQQVVPDQIKGGVYVPAHEMYVIAREGHWEVEEVGGELTGLRLTPGEAVSATAADAAESWYLLPWLLEKFKDRGSMAVRNDPNQLAPLFVLAVVLAGGLGYWWLQLPEASRLEILATVARAEGTAVADRIPRDSIPMQVWWMVRHRGGQLEGMVRLVALSVVVGTVEGGADGRA